MGLKDALGKLVSHPATAVGVTLSAVLQVVGVLDPVWSLISATSGTWFPAIAVTAGTILPEFGFGDVGTSVLVAAAVVFVAVQLDKFAEQATEWARERFNS